MLHNTTACYFRAGWFMCLSKESEIVMKNVLFYQFKIVKTFSLRPSNTLNYQPLQGA